MTTTSTWLKRRASRRLQIRTDRSSSSSCWATTCRRFSRCRCRSLNRRLAKDTTAPGESLRAQFLKRSRSHRRVSPLRLVPHCALSQRACASPPLRHQPQVPSRAPSRCWGRPTETLPESFRAVLDCSRMKQVGRVEAELDARGKPLRPGTGRGPTTRFPLSQHNKTAGRPMWARCKAKWPRSPKCRALLRDPPAVAGLEIQ